ncbi:MAG: hypothetical protein Q9226_003086 [Calogaya cf. arnoldii]
MASTIPYKDAWARARDRYVKDLSATEKSLYNTASPESIFYDASAAQKIHTSSSSGAKVADKLRPLVTAIEQYGKALDVYANAYPLVLSPLWGSIRIVLQLACEYSKYFERIVDMFASIGDLLPRFRVYENLFPSQERLVQALSITYIDVLTFCTEAKAVFRSERRSSRVGLAILAKLSWKPFERQFGQLIDNFRNHAKNVEKEASLSHMIAASDSRAIVRANQTQLEKVKKEDAHRRIIATIPSVDAFAKHRKLQGISQEGTSTWILRHNAYKDWYDAARSSTVCCIGIPGSGKTVLASFVVDTLLTNAVSQNSRVVYYYCDYADQRTLQPERILGTILKQFFVNGHIPGALEKKFPRGYGEDRHTLNFDDLVDLVFLAIRQTALTYIIIDGLDECERDARKEMSRFVDRLQGIVSPTTKVFISCRQEDQILRSLQDVPMIDLTPSALKDDIRLFVAASVSSRMTSGELRIRNPDLAKDITDELVGKAHGMFLWVFFQLDDLCEAPSDALIRKTLQNLPDGLVETYDRVLKKIWRDTIKRDMVRKAFMWMGCARRPLRIEELREAAGFETNQKSWDSDMLPDADRMIEACKGLVVWDREDGIVRFAHHTVRQFLISGPTGTQESNLRCNNIEAELYVGEMCLTYLLFSDFENQIQVRPAHTHKSKALDVPQAGPAYWIPEMLGVRTSILERPFQLLRLGSSSSPDVDYAKYLGPASGGKEISPSREIVDKYRLLQYIIDNWVFHTNGFDSYDSSLSQKLQDLAMYKSLPFEFRPWGRNQHHGPYGCVSCKPGASSSEADRLPFMSLLHYAVNAGHLALSALIGPLVKEYCSHEADNYKRVDFDWDAEADCWLLQRPLLSEHRSSGRSNDQTVLIAIRKDYRSLVEYITTYYNRASLPTFVTMINTAASCGHVEMLRFLLDHLKTNRYKPKYYALYVRDYSHITLAFAAANGLRADVEKLQREGAWIDRRVDKLGETAISAAAANGDDHMVRFLVGNGALLLGWGVTALHYAAKNGHANVASTLLELPQERWKFDPLNKADRPQILGALDHEGETPLHKAARNGHADVVQVMLERAATTAGWVLATTPASSAKQTALHLAAANGHLAVVRLLREYGTLVDANIKTPLMRAAEENHVLVVKALVEVNDQ